MRPIRSKPMDPSNPHFSAAPYEHRKRALFRLVLSSPCSMIAARPGNATVSVLRRMLHLGLDLFESEHNRFLIFAENVSHGVRDFAHCGMAFDCVENRRH